MAPRKTPPESPVNYWHSLLRPEVELTPAYFEEFAAKLRAARLTFGDRVHCPFLRPFFLSEEDEARILPVCETIAALGERIAATAMDSPDLMRQLGMREPEERLARIDPGYARASTASRLDSFVLPDSLEFAEYNAESPAGPGYTELLGEIFDGLPLMDRFKQRFSVRSYAPMNRLLNALLESYREWGGNAAPPQIAIVDWREVPTWNEFEIIQARFERLGVPTLVCDPRDLEFNGRSLTAQGKRIDLLYRRVLVNDIIERPAECDALLRAYQARAVCVANTFRCKIPHKKAFFAVLTDERNDDLFSSAERDLVRRHVPWTRLIAEIGTTHDGKRVNLIEHSRRCRENLVIKPNDEYGGAGVSLGWEMTAAAWDATIQKALGDAPGTWIVQEKIAIRREMFPVAQPGEPTVLRDMLVDSAPYLFRGRLSGFLTRLSATGLANVTSGGGQVPVFIVSSKSAPRGKRAIESRN
jgi:hypothetical protein